MSKWRSAIWLFGLAMAIGTLARAADPLPPMKLMLVGTVPLHRLSVYAQRGILDRALGERCAGRLSWTSVYAGYHGPVGSCLNRIDGFIEKEKADVVLISYGQDDITLGAAKADPAVYERDLRKLLDAIRRKSPATAIILATSIPFRRDVQQPAVADADVLLERNVNSATRRIAQEQKLPLIDLYRVFAAYGPERLIDGEGKWPNTMGRQLMARSLCDGIAQWACAARLKTADAVRADHEAAARVADAAKLKALQPGQAWAKLQEAVRLCPYLAEAWAMMDEIQAKGGPRAIPDKTKDAVPALEGVRQANLVLLGDSVTRRSLGQFVITGELEDVLNRRCDYDLLWSAVNQGTGGETIPRALKRIQSVLDKCQPDYMTVSYGLNDMYFTDAITDPAVFETNLRTLIKTIQAHPCKPQIFLMTSTPWHDRRLKSDPNRVKFDPIFDPKGGANAVLERDINATTRRIARELGLPLFDNHRLLMANDIDKMIGKDGVHLTTEGGHVLQEGLESRISAFIRARVLKKEDAIKAEETARGLVKEAEALKGRDPAQAREKLQRAGAACPYLADIWVLMDDTAMKGGK